MGSELDFDELERLIDTIPNVASANGHTVESVSKSLSPLSANSCNGTSMEILHSDGNFYTYKLPQPRTSSNLTRESIRSGDWSLTSALEKLSLTGEATEQTWKSWKKPTILKEDQFPSSLNEQLFNKDASMLAIPSLSSSNHLSSGFPDFHMTRLGHQNSPSLTPQYKKWQVSNHQPFETSSPTVPFSHEEPNANVSVPSLQFPLMSHYQQILQSGRSPVSHLHPQQTNLHQISRNYAQAEQFNRINGQYLYLHPIHNQQLECPSSFEHCDMIAKRMSLQAQKQQYFEVPVSHNLERSNNEQFRKGHTFYRDLNQSSPVFSTGYMDTIQGKEKSSKQNFPKNFLTRNLDGTKILSVDADKSINHISQSRVAYSNCYTRQNNLSPGIECSCLTNIKSSAALSDSNGFKTSPQRFNSVDEVTGMIYLMAKDQHGCRFLQQKFVEGTRKDIEKIFKEIIDHVVELMIDTFGNYLVQKLLEVCDEDQLMQILYKITRKHGELVRISCDTHGTRAIQKVIETLRTREQFSMIASSLMADIVTLMKDVNGNHVAQHCLQYMMPGYNAFLFDAATNCCVELATDRHGCCVLQKCLRFPDCRQRDILISEITRNSLFISQDQYGNYVVQFILGLQLPWATIDILKQLEGNYGALSMQKYSSNVVEKCLQYVGVIHLTRIVEELINDPQLDQIMQDAYGNYAIQTAYHESKGTLRAKLVDAIRPLVPVLRKNPFGRKVLAMLAKN